MKEQSAGNKVSRHLPQCTFPCPYSAPRQSVLTPAWCHMFMFKHEHLVLSLFKGWQARSIVQIAWKVFVLLQCTISLNVKNWTFAVTVPGLHWSCMLQLSAKEMPALQFLYKFNQSICSTFMKRPLISTCIFFSFSKHVSSVCNKPVNTFKVFVLPLWNGHLYAHTHSFGSMKVVCLTSRWIRSLPDNR